VPTSALDPQPLVLLFDGVCLLCNRSVDWLIRHDPHATLRFAPQQSPVGQQLLAAHGIEPSPRSVIAIDGDAPYGESTAVIRVLMRLPDPWPDVARLFESVPPSLRDAAYRLVARHRYAWFGRRDTCRLPTAEERERFL
jgi:predicted DCC family thiol-disulfide oxidoreductase YuxK